MEKIAEMGFSKPILTSVVELTCTEASAYMKDWEDGKSHLNYKDALMVALHCFAENEGVWYEADWKKHGIPEEHTKMIYEEYDKRFPDTPVHKEVVDDE